MEIVWIRFPVVYKALGVLDIGTVTGIVASEILKSFLYFKI